jgi:hypothetical protein
MCVLRLKMTSQQSDSRIPEAESAWTEETLKHLNASYVKKTCTDFTFPILRIPAELNNGESL